MIVTRWSKIAMCLALAGFALIVAFDNLVDYRSNYAFVRHVLSMDTTFAGNRLLDRAVVSPALWRIAYALIIATEALTGLLFAIAAVALWRARRASGAAFERAKQWAVAAATVGFLLWFFGFGVVGGEWLAMWQSPKWNGQMSAFRFTATILGVLIFLNQPDADLRP